MGKVWVIASGKGGVGKSTITAGLGQALSRRDQKVCIVDADIGLRDQDTILGLENQVVYDLLDVCRRECVLQQALIPVQDFEGLSLLPAAQFARCRDVDEKEFRKLIRRLKNSFDVVLIDCPAGIEKGLRTVIKAETDETLIVCTPDDVCIRDAERTAAIFQEKGSVRPRLLVNRLDPALIRSREMYPAAVVAQTLDLALMGEIPDDPQVYRCLLNHRPLLACECEARAALERIAARMLGETADYPCYGSEKKGFFARLFHR